jgi:hypothetical protein
MDAAREFRNPNLMGVVFRESYPNLQDLIKKAYRLYSGYPYLGDYNKAERIWRFPTNAKELADLANIEAVAHKRIVPVYDDGQCAQILFRHMANDDDVQQLSVVRVQLHQPPRDGTGCREPTEVVPDSRRLSCGTSFAGRRDYRVARFLP